jgi:ubiquinone/menaquinone biosynthesis C-methylase UbiE
LCGGAPAGRRSKALSDKSVRLAEVLESLIDFEGVSKIVEIGCGQGRLATRLSRMVEGHGEVLAFDTNEEIVRQAARGARFAGVSNLGFKVGDVYELPLPDGFADVVVCSNLLCSLSDVDAAVKEMRRVAKKGGLLALAEPAGRQLFHDPDSQRFMYLSEQLNQAFQRGWAAKGVDQSVGLRVPEILLRNGMEEIAGEVVCQMFLLCDARRGLQDIEDQLVTEACDLSEPTVAMLAKGGLSGKELKEHNVKAKKRLAAFRSNASEVRNRGYVRVMPPFLVYVGTTPDA